MYQTDAISAVKKLMLRPLFVYSGCAIHVGQQIPYLIALCPFSMYQTDAISAVNPLESDSSKNLE
jgi:hypothetical protein